MNKSKPPLVSLYILLLEKGKQRGNAFGKRPGHDEFHPRIRKITAIYFYIPIRTIACVDLASVQETSRKNSIGKNRDVYRIQNIVSGAEAGTSFLRRDSVDCEEWRRVEITALHAHIHVYTSTAQSKGRKGARSRTTANCQVPFRTTNNRKCSHNNADTRRCGACMCTREHSRALASEYRVCDIVYTCTARTRESTTQISSAITRTALVNARGPSCSFPCLIPHLALKIEATCGSASRSKGTLLTGECTERITRDACFGNVGSLYRFSVRTATSLRCSHIIIITVNNF